MKRLLMSTVIALSLMLTVSAPALAQVFSQPPYEVQNVQATPGDGTIEVTWDAADDPDGVVIGYKVYYGLSPVQTVNDLYDDELQIPTQTSYTLSGLQNGTPYFIALTAIDDEGNESNTYSVEVSAVPMSDEIMEEEPQAPVEEPEMTTEEPEEIELPVVEQPEEPVISEPLDTEPPADARLILLDTAQLSAKGVVTFIWGQDHQDESDIADQFLYSRQGDGEWRGPIALGGDTRQIELEVDMDTEYALRLQSVDEAGNMSQGLFVTFSTEVEDEPVEISKPSGPVQTLPQTGSGSSLVLLFAILFGGGLIMYRRHNA